MLRRSAHRRNDPGGVLAVFAEDRISEVRARAYRATGQLGRPDLMTGSPPASSTLTLNAASGPPGPRRAWAPIEPLDVLADIAWNNLPRADRALDLLLRRLDVPQANAWLREFAKLPGRQRSLIRATGVIGDPLYIPWLIERMAEPATARTRRRSHSR